jgi:hypothetical protein
VRDDHAPLIIQHRRLTIAWPWRRGAAVVGFEFRPGFLVKIEGPDVVEEAACTAASTACATSCGLVLGISTLRIMSVSTAPGNTACTRMPFLPSSARTAVYRAAASR